jgi:hypothetical protein
MMKTATIEGIDMASVTERLRASKKDHLKKLHADGVNAGTEWAAESAEAAELIQLATWKEQLAGDWDACFVDSEHRSNSAAADFVFTVWPEDDGDHVVASSFWEGQGFDGRDPEGEFVRGFAEGALEIWDAVESKI